MGLNESWDTHQLDGENVQIYCIPFPNHLLNEMKLKMCSFAIQVQNRIHKLSIRKIIYIWLRVELEVTCLFNFRLMLYIDLFSCLLC